MEDFSTIIWVVIFGAAMVFSAASKARKNMRKSDKENPNEAWPTQFDVPEANEETDSGIHGNRFDTVKSAFEENPGQDSYEADNSISDAHSFEEVGHTSETSEGAKNLAQEFELRKAVIYSEILKPKFDE